MISAVLFDLDLTLVDSREAEPHRRKGGWSQAYRLIPTLPVYDGVHDVLASVRRAGIKTAVVTASPSTYCGKLVGHHGWSFDATVCYHDTRQHKPHPAPIELALRRLGVPAGEAAYVGDDVKDVHAARAAGVVSVGALWGSKDPGSLRRAGADHLCERAEELRVVLQQLSGAPL